MFFADLSWNISVSSLVILAAYVFEICLSWGKSDRHRQMKVKTIPPRRPRTWVIMMMATRTTTNVSIVFSQQLSWCCKQREHNFIEYYLHRCPHWSCLLCQLVYQHTEKGGKLYIDGRNVYRQYHIGPCSNYNSVLFGGINTRITGRPLKASCRLSLSPYFELLPPDLRSTGSLFIFIHQNGTEKNYNTKTINSKRKNRSK